MENDGHKKSTEFLQSGGFFEEERDFYCLIEYNYT
jgi:hypothetical protein